VVYFGLQLPDSSKSLLSLTGIMQSIGSKQREYVRAIVDMAVETTDDVTNSAIEFTKDKFLGTPNLQNITTSSLEGLRSARACLVHVIRKKICDSGSRHYLGISVCEVVNYSLLRARTSSRKDGTWKLVRVQVYRGLCNSLDVGRANQWGGAFIKHYKWHVEETSKE